MFCNKCGASLRDGAKFCNVCGEMTKYGKGLATEQPTPVPVTEPTSAVQTAPVIPPAPPIPEPEPVPEPPKIQFPEPIPVKKARKYEFQTFEHYWNCEYCGSWNDFSDTFCQDCGENRPNLPQRQSALLQAAESYNNEQTAVIGWICPKCGANNPKLAGYCKECGQYR